MISPVRAFVSPLVAGLVVLAACGTPDETTQQDTVAAVADRLAEQTAAGDDCGARETAAQLQSLVADEQALPEASRAKVADFLASLDAQLQCEPEPEPEPTPTEEPKPDPEKDDKPGKGKGRDRGNDDDDDDEDD